MDIQRTSSTTRNLLILQAIHQAAALPHIRSEEASGVAVTEGDARLRSQAFGTFVRWKVAQLRFQAQASERAV